MTDSENETKTELSRFNQENPPPKVRRFLTKEPRGKSTETLGHGAFIFKAYDHLREHDSPTTQAFIDAQNLRSQAFLEKNATFQKEMAEVDAMRNDVQQQGDWQNGKTIEAEGRRFSNRTHSDTGAYEYFIQSDEKAEPIRYLTSEQFSATHSSRLRQIQIAKDGKSVIYRIEHAGKNTDEVRHVAFNEDGSFSDTHQAEVSMGKVGELDIDADMKGFNYHSWNKKGENWVMKHHVIGDAPENDTLIHDMGSKGSTPRYSRITKDDGKSSEMEYLRAEWNLAKSNALQMRPRGSEEPFKEIKRNGQSYFRPIAEVDGKVIVLTNENAPRGKLIALDLKNPENETTLIGEHAEDVLERAQTFKGKLLVTYKHDTASRLAFHEYSGAHIQDVPLPAQSTIQGYPPKKDQNADFAVNVESFTADREVYDYTFKDNSLKRTHRAEQRLDNAVVERITATSKDGTEVPMTVIRPKGVKLDGTAAVQLNGYGGFGHSMDAGWNEVAADWVGKGGIYVVANLRGGGEFGQEWYDGGRLQNKQNTFDDFAACAEKLIEKNYTKPERLSISGTSNGGLLTLASALQRPELFGAVVSQVPVADMLYGGWDGDYGKPRSKRADFEKAMSYSPVHNIREKQVYPPMLVSTSTKDSTVPAWHSLTFAAAMQDKSPETLCLLKVSKEWEHNPTTADGFKQRTAEAHAFIEQAIGPIDQKQYKASLKTTDIVYKDVIPPPQAMDASWEERVGGASGKTLNQTNTLEKAVSKELVRRELVGAATNISR